MGTEEPILSIKVKLLSKSDGLKVYEMPVTWGAGKALLAAGVDPNTLWSQARADESWNPTLGQMVTMIHVGVTVGGAKITEDEVGESVVTRGMAAYEPACAHYILAFAAGGIAREWIEKGAASPDPLGPDGTGSPPPTKSQSDLGESSPSSSGA